MCQHTRAPSSRVTHNNFKLLKVLNSNPKSKSGKKPATSARMCNQALDRAGQEMLVEANERKKPATCARKCNQALDRAGQDVPFEANVR